MNSLTKIVPNVKKYSDYLFDINKNKTPIMLSGLTDTGKVHIAYSTKFYTDKPICIITYNEMQAKKILLILIMLLKVKTFCMKELVI